MVLASASYVANDSLMKLATSGLPPYEVLLLRGVAATVLGVPLLLVLGYGRQIALVTDRRVLTRNVFELAAILAYVVALANMPIADVVALGQVTPLLVLLGASLLFGERVGALRTILIGLGFAGALMVAQPTPAGISAFAVLGLLNAVASAARDLASRRVAAEIPGIVVAVSAVLAVLVGAGLAHLAWEDWVMPDARHLWLLLGAGFFLIFGHFFIFMAYRIGPARAVAPFYYSFSVWAVLAGAVVFSELPGALAACGIAVVILSGLAVVALDSRSRRLAVTA